MKSRGLVSVAAFCAVIVSGGWLIQRGFLRLAHPAVVVDGRQLYEQVLGHVARAYIEPLPADSLYRRTIEGVLRELNDPHSVYLSPQRLARLTESTSGRYAGIGIQIDVRDDWITVISPLVGGPAREAGIQSGDRIVEIDGNSTFRWTSEEAQRALRGPAGTTVRIAVQRPELSARLPFTLRRREIRVSPVQHSLMIGDRIGYIDLVVFSDDAAAGLRSSIDSLRRAGMEALILDLRGDPGGLLDEGVAVADLFLDAGKAIVGLSGQGEGVSRKIEGRFAQRWPDLVLTVLVDSNSASASEIVAGALQDHDRALIVGTRTFGKGSAQSVIPLTDGGGLKLTTARWYTPLGRSIDRAADTTTLRSTGADPVERRDPEYRTPAGRTVFGGGGIVPDIVLADSVKLRSEAALRTAVGDRAVAFRDLLAQYAASIRSSSTVRSHNFAITPEMRAELLRRAATRGILFDSLSAEAAAYSIDQLLGAQVVRQALGPDAEFRRVVLADALVRRAAGMMAGARTQPELLAAVRR